jgi:signal peptidase
MIPTYRLGDIVIDRPPGALHRGEVITFRHSATSNVIVTHRINSIADGEIHTKGDANPTPDAWAITRAEVEGQVVRSVPRLGYVIVFFKQPAGIGSAMTAGIALLLLWDLFFRVAPLEDAAAPGADSKRRRGAHRAVRTRGATFRRVAESG